MFDLTMLEDEDVALVGADVDLARDVDNTIFQADRIASLCGSVHALNAFGADPMSVRILQRAGQWKGVALNGVSAEALSACVPGDNITPMSMEGLSSLADDAGKALLHGTAAHSGEIGAKVMGHAVAVERATLKAEKALLAKLEEVRSEQIAHVMGQDIPAMAKAFAAGLPEKEALKAGEAARMAAAKVHLDSANMTDAERALVENTKGTHLKKWFALTGSRWEKQNQAVKDAKKALENAKTAEGAKAAIAHVKAARAEQARLAALRNELAGKGARVLSAKNVLIALSAAAGVAMGMKLLFRSVPATNATVEAKNAYFSKIVSWVRGIKLPWAKLDVNEGGKLLVNGKPVKGALGAAEEAAGKAADSASPGWTKELLNQATSKVKGMGDTIKGAFGGLAGQFDHLSDVGEAAGKAAEAQSKSAMARATNVFAKSSRVAMVMALIGLVGAVIYFVVIGGMKLAHKSLNAQK